MKTKTTKKQTPELALLREALDALNQIPRHTLHVGDSYDLAARISKFLRAKGAQ